MEDAHPRGALLAGLFNVDEDVLGPVAHLEKTHVGRLQGGAQQVLQHPDVSGRHAMHGGRSQLVRHQLAGVVDLLAQVL
jgi:hypothetical protein